MGFEFDKSGRSYYVPSAFYINVSTDVFDDEGRPRVDGWYTLMHEYTHLIQDRTTFYGALDFLIFFDWVRAIAGTLPAFGSEVRIPLSQARETQRHVHELFALRSTMHARDDWENGKWWAVESFDLVDRFVLYEDEERSIKVAMASFVDNVSDDKYCHEIGPREIKEAYAVAVHMLFGGPHVETANEFEYLAVERILQQFGKVEPRHYVSICHWALQDPTPGVRLFEICELLKARTFSELPDAEALYDLLREDAMRRGFAESVEQLTRQLSEVQLIQSTAGEGDFLAKILNWYKLHVVAALRRNIDPGRRFPLDTCLCGPFAVGFGEAFEALTAEEPIPIVADSSGRVVAYGREEQDGLDTKACFFFRAMGDLLNRLWGSIVFRQPCPLHSQCTLQFKDHECLELRIRRTDRVVT